MKTVFQKDIQIKNTSGNIFLADTISPEQIGQYPLVMTSFLKS